MEKLVKKLEYLFTSPNECDMNGEIANIVDGLFAISRGLHHIAESVDRLEKKVAEKLNL